jgi:hypothetical protein
VESGGRLQAIVYRVWATVGYRQSDGVRGKLQIVRLGQLVAQTSEQSSSTFLLQRYFSAKSLRSRILFFKVTAVNFLQFSSYDSKSLWVQNSREFRKELFSEGNIVPL